MIFLLLVLVEDEGTNNSEYTLFFISSMSALDIS